jgi:hypothetical protein
LTDEEHNMPIPEQNGGAFEKDGHQCRRPRNAFIDLGEAIIMSARAGWSGQLPRIRLGIFKQSFINDIDNP